MIFSMEPGFDTCEFPIELKESLVIRGIYCCYDSGLDTVHLHLWFMQYIAAATGVDLMELVMDALTHEELHAVFNVIGEMTTRNFDVVEEALILSLRAGLDWTLDA